MNRLREILGYAAAVSKFDMGRLESTEGHPLRSYAARPDEIVSDDQLRQIFEQGVREAGDGGPVRSAKLVCGDGPISALVGVLRGHLQSYIDPKTERIGLAFYLLSGSDAQGYQAFQDNQLLMTSCVTPLKSFARALVTGTALVGSEHIAYLVNGWAQGEPLRYQTCAILNGVTIDEPLALGRGVRVMALPSSTPEFRRRLRSLAPTSLEEYSGKTMVMIESSASPSLFRPGDEHQNGTVKVSTDSNVNVESICQALSLLSDTYVDAEVCWNDYLELEDWVPPSVSCRWSLSSGIPRPRWQDDRSLRNDRHTGIISTSVSGGDNLQFTKQDIDDVLGALVAPGFRELRTAASRWMRSKNSADDLVDQFVDLRMALEALYLHDFANEDSGEMQFRLALMGAWFLGVDFEDRKRIRKILRDAYRRASGAVHTGKVDFTPENRQLLINAQSLCRNGILKLTAAGFPADWGDLVLGSTG